MNNMQECFDGVSMRLYSALMHSLWGLVACLILLLVPRLSLSLDSLTELDLEDLVNLEVTSVSKRVQPLSDTPAAVYVISSMEIKRSGATSVPDALRLAPGVEVAKLNSSIWAVSIRGMNSMYSHHLQVLVDGRSVYTPLYGGVYWDLVMPMLEDIDRIEVIRGPGASLWGVNAVNGVINIITKSAELTQGQRIVVAVGHQENHFRVRSGARSGNLFYRGYAVLRDTEDSVDKASGKSAGDEMQGAQLGGRVDWVNGKERVVIQSGISAVDKSYNHTFSERIGQAGERFNNLSATVSGLWNKPIENDDLQLQLYADYVKRDEPGCTYSANSYDLDIQYNHAWHGNNRVTWGFHYRYFDGELDGSAIYELFPSQQSLDIYSAFIQNEHQFTPRLTFVTGLKIEKIADIDTAWQPTLRFNYRFSNELSYWGSASIAARAPAIHERYVRFTNEYPEYLREYTLQFIRDLLPPGSAPIPDNAVLVGTLLGNENLKLETTTTYELGLRWQPADNFFFDVSGFYSLYADLRGLEQVSWEPIAGGFLGTVMTANTADGTFYGIEVATEYRPVVNLRLKLNFNALQVAIKGDNELLAAEFLEGSSPSSQISFRTYWDINEVYSLNLDVYYVDDIKSGGNTAPSGYADANVRFAWQVAPELNVSLNVLNAFHDQRFEYQETLIGPQPTEIKRSVYLQVDWKH